MDTSRFHLFALGESAALGARVGRHLGVEPSAHEEREFEDGEHKERPLVDVRGCHAWVLGSLHGGPERSADDELCRLLFFAGALKDAAAKSVSVLAPYLCYSRKDRRTKPHDPVTTRYVACLLEAVGVDRVVTVDVHNLAAFQNAFRVPTVHLEAGERLAAELARELGDGPVAVASPDLGGVKRAHRFGEALERALGRETARVFVEKHRSDDVVSGDALVGPVRGSTVVLVDDLIATGTTLLRAARACRAAGARRVLAAATHGAFVGDANATLAGPEIDLVLVTDTIPPFRVTAGALREKLRVLDCSSLLAGAIRAPAGGAHR
jgi:ribose-phosphate pyrophosphokinase